MKKHFGESGSLKVLTGAKPEEFDLLLEGSGTDAEVLAEALPRLLMAWMLEAMPLSKHGTVELSWKMKEYEGGVRRVFGFASGGVVVERTLRIDAPASPRSNRD